jgi:hypothetical protein
MVYVAVPTGQISNKMIDFFKGLYDRFSREIDELTNNEDLNRRLFSKEEMNYYWIELWGVSNLCRKQLKDVPVVVPFHFFYQNKNEKRRKINTCFHIT